MSYGPDEFSTTRSANLLLLRADYHATKILAVGVRIARINERA